jgi:two-component system, NarL family, sensor kinase
MHAPDLLFGVRASLRGQYVYESINPAFEVLLGISSENIREKSIADCMGDEDAESIYASCDSCLTKGRPVRHRHRLALGGCQRNFETIVAPVRDTQSGSIVGLIGSHRAVKERATGDAVRRTSTRGAASKRGGWLLSLQEEVQQRIASDLHDSTCQHLIAASLNVMRMRRTVGDIGTAATICDDIDASINQVLREIRAFSHLLHPQNLLADGLKSSIEQFVRGFSARTSLKAIVDIVPEVDKLPFEKQRSVLRVVQEALANIFRHAKATQVRIVMEVEDTHFRLQISDNGRGMPVGKMRSGAKPITFGVGIPAMKTRLQQMGGALEIHSSSTTECRGTTLSAVIPHSLRRKRARQPERRHSHLSHNKFVAEPP